MTIEFENALINNILNRTDSEPKQKKKRSGESKLDARFEFWEYICQNMKHRKLSLANCSHIGMTITVLC